MAHTLITGANCPLPTTVWRIAITWAPTRPAEQEVDASAFLLTVNGQVRSDADFIFYNQPRSLCGGVELSHTKPAHQQLRIDPERLPAAITRIAIGLTLGGGVTFARAEHIRLLLCDDQWQEIARFEPPTAGMTEAALILGEVYRYREQWKFRALGQGFRGGLAALAQNFGVTIKEEPVPPPAPPAMPPPPPPPRRSPPAVAHIDLIPSNSQREYSTVADLHYEVLYRGAYPLVCVDLPQGRQLRAQSDAMVAMHPTVDVGSEVRGGLLGGITRMVSGESFFLQTLSASRGAGSVYFASAFPGDIAAIDITQERGLVIQRGGFLACSESVEVSTKVQNLAQGLFSREGFFILKAEGRGLIFLESFGAIVRMELGHGQQKIVDNGHLVAWSQTMHYTLELGNPGIVAAFTSGENIVCRFHGPGTLLIQSRQPKQFARWVRQVL